jgi:hypothetical protein
MRAQLMRMAEDGPLQRAPLWERGDLGAPQGGLVLEYLRECRIVRKALDGSLAKVASPAALTPSLHTTSLHRRQIAMWRWLCPRMAMLPCFRMLMHACRTAVRMPAGRPLTVPVPRA